MSKKRNLYLVIGTIAMIIYGLMYSWTVFSPFVQEEFQIHQSRVANVFSYCQIGFCLGGLFGGFIYYKLNYKISMLFASISIFLGLYITSVAETVTIILIGFSFLYNFMAGFAYKTVLTAVLSWFKDKPGFASGVIVMGAGLTAFVFNTPLSRIIQMYDWHIAMKVLAYIAGFLSLINALCIKPNDAKMQKKNADISEINQTKTKEMVMSPKFYVYFVWSVLLLASCSSISGTAVNCGLTFGLTATIAAKLTMIISLSNSLNRIVYGIIFDKIGRKCSMRIATYSFVLAVLLIFTAFKINNVYLLMISFLCFGICFGGIPTISSAYILTTFGSKYYPSNFSVQGLYSLFSPILGTMVYSKLLLMTENVVLAYSYLILYACLAIILLGVLNKILKR